MRPALPDPARTGTTARRRRRRRRPLAAVAVIVVSALSMAVAIVALSAQVGVAASGACTSEPGGQVCLSAVSYSPASVSNTAQRTITVTATLTQTGTASTCVDLEWPFPTTTGTDGVFAYLSPVAGRPGSWQGPLILPAAARPGSYAPELAEDCSQAWSLSATQLAAGGVTNGYTVTGATDSTAPAMTGLTASGTSFDVTRQAAQVALQVHVTDAGSGAVSVHALTGYTPAPGSNPASHIDGIGSDLTLTSGTAQDGIWSGGITLQAGSSGSWPLSLSATDQAGNTATLTSAQLKAAGRPYTFTSRTTAAPAAASGLNGTDQYILLKGTWHATVTFGQSIPAGTGRWTDVLVTSSSACGTILFPPSALYDQWTYQDRQWPVPCTVKVTLANAAGSSPVTTYTFI